MPKGTPLYRIARDQLLSLGIWRLRIAEQFNKRIEPEDPFIASQRMASQFIPYIDAYIDQGGRFVLGELGQQDADDLSLIHI